MIASPVAAGSKVSLDGEDLCHLRKSLIEDGEFSEAAADEIEAAFGEQAFRLLAARRGRR